ncbi:MAG: nucleotidyltransferase domain-containing protein [Deltaproteobacteria bacterium]
MARRTLRLGAETITLPRGTRVVLRVDVPGDGFLHRQASIATVQDVHKNTYSLVTPSGRTLTAQRDQIAVQRQDLLADLGQRKADFESLAEHVVYAAVVGSQAWGLAGPDSDEDVRGAFVLPFDSYTSLWDAPDEIQDPAGDRAFWEIEKLLHQGLRGDANTLECLWTPLVKSATPIGERLRGERRMFVSMNVLGSFGRYAQSQFKKIERSLERNAALTHLLAGIKAGIDSIDGAAAHLTDGDDKTRRREITAMVRSTFDRGLIDRADFGAMVEAVRTGRRAELEPGPHRPKNAYNLLRLLHSCLSWLRTGEPLIEVTGELHATLLAIKQQRTPIEDTLARAQAVAAEIDEAAHEAKLPESPDYDAADRLLRDARRAQARVALAVPGPIATDALAPTLLPVALPPDVDVDSMRRFLTERGQPERGRTMWIALSGAHAYGFPSVDSDLDVKGTFVAPSRDAIGFAGVPPATDFLGDFAGREYDLTLNEIDRTARSILTGNGNYIERFLGPLPLLTTELGRRFGALVAKNLSRQVYGHYRGFSAQVRKRYEAEAAEDKRIAKRLLYVYRTALTGLHLLKTGEVETDATKIASTYGFDSVHALARIKASEERRSLSAEEAAPYVADLDALDAALAAAHEASILPEAPAEADALEDFVVSLRLGSI